LFLSTSTLQLSIIQAHYFKYILTLIKLYKLQIWYFYKVKKIFFTFILFAVFGAAKAQKIDSIFVNLYTDSLKKGTYNYINVDGLMSNGKYLPLDSGHIIFKSDHGQFFGNSLWLDKNFKEEKVHISVCLKNNAASKQEFDMYVKKKEDGPLKTADQLMNEWKRKN
jgi:hypothetical protein